MEQLVDNYHSVFSTSFIYERPISSTFPIRRFPSCSRKCSARSNPRMSTAASTSDAQKPVIQQQKVIIPKSHGGRLLGLLHETGSEEIVILCHGFLCTKETNIIANLAVALENEGISVFRFDFAGNGESEGSFRCGGYWIDVDDLHAVIQYFHDEKRVVHAILGHSRGGRVVLLYASKYHDIHMVLNVSARCNQNRDLDKQFGKDYLERIKKDGFLDVNIKGNIKFRVTEEDLMDHLNTDLHEACLKIEEDCRVLTIHGSADDFIPVEDALEFSKIIPNHKLHIIEGADHVYTSHQAELALVVSSFLRTGLQEGKG